MKNKKNIPSVTIGIPAHNEEGNIGRLLDSILVQKNGSYKLQKLIVACDGCTDKTAEIVKDYGKKYKFISVIDDGKRFGQGGRLSNFYKLNKSDIFITFDADSVLGHNLVMEQLVKPFSDKSVGLVAGGDTPSRGKTLVAKAIVTKIDLWHETRKDINSGDSVHNHHGCVSAMSFDFCKQVEYPKNSTGNDEFLYLKAKQLGFGFKFARTAIVYYSAPDNLHDYLKQSTRFLISKDKLYDYFGENIKSLYPVPMKYKIKAMIKMLLKEPLLLPLAIAFHYLVFLLHPLFTENISNGIWTSVGSTKKVNTI